MGFGAPPILGGILVGIGMFTESLFFFDPWPYQHSLKEKKVNPNTSTKKAMLFWVLYSLVPHELSSLVVLHPKGHLLDDLLAPAVKHKPQAEPPCF